MWSACLTWGGGGGSRKALQNQVSWGMLHRQCLEVGKTLSFESEHLVSSPTLATL